ncbi:MAG: hypothetical protein QOF48_3808 [Verrucomicrobiota bacterium]|jgi:hypothetical protein
MQPAKNTFILITFLASLMSCVARDASKANETLLRASSPFEDMVEFALARNDAGLNKSLTAADSAAAAVRDALPGTATTRFDTLLQSIHKAATAKEHYAVALSAVETFRLLIDNLDAGSLTVPKEVSLLDYAGFKLHVLAAAPQPDWGAMRRMVDDAAGWWTAIKPKVSDKSLRNAFTSTIRGLQQAGKAEHLPMLNFAAQMDLDLVDLLEGYFERKK